jgi:monoamine oxidase
VLAAPLPALRDIEFEPALPEALAGAIAEMQYARIVKTQVQYEDRFWRREGWSGDLFTDRPMGNTWEATDRQRGRRGILLAYAAGRTHDRLLAAATGRETEYLVDELDRFYPGSGRFALDGAAFDWAADPYAGGCWMQAAPGQVVPYWRALREPVGRIVLAGEHTSTMPGYMEGALRSGIAAAEAIESAG